VVSGATGGVGALSVSILKKLGYKVAAITGKETARDYLTLELRLLSCEKILNPWIINRF
jgi:NADPH:quinone reductase-like Zn-dependent oxidoreductase